jgi:hypothetical protein
MIFEPFYTRNVDLHGFIEGLCNKGGPYGDCVRVYEADEVDAEWMAHSQDDGKLERTITRLEESLTELRGKYERAVWFLQDIGAMISKRTAGSETALHALAQLGEHTSREPQ